ncbi:MAG: 4Fe-4S dicluster domain-containing protein [Desulfobacteraceae bacterium]|nr:4Fe-4S dicluster domain-containing protein [Desulfobacteraceae bacterium]
MRRKTSMLSKTRFVSQVFFSLLFCAGILMAGNDYWPLPEDFFFRLDPLLAVICMPAAGTLLCNFLLSASVVALTVFAGRFFCGWICPLGACIDFFEWITRGFKRPEILNYRIKHFCTIKYGILVFVLAAAGFSFQFLYFFDPIIIMTRFTGMLLLPFKKEILHQSPFVVKHAFEFIVFVFFILMLSFLARRFWCRALCPLGALFGILGTFSRFEFNQKKCNSCQVCQKICKTGAIADPLKNLEQTQECIRCFDCLNVCPQNARRFGYCSDFTRWPKSSQDTVNLSRRTFIGWGASGMAAAVIFAPKAVAMPGKKYLLRPPHAPEEEAFLDLCLRCQACVNVCPTNALQPVFFQSGLYGLWTPALAPSVGACKIDCNACAKVCPTGAIGKFTHLTKYHLKIGTAVLNKNRCLPWAENKPCGKCLQHCPTGAIGFTREDEMEKPERIDFLLCVGCGICQYVCNRQTLGPPALIITAKGRNQPSGVAPVTIKTFLENKQKKIR